MLVGYARTSTVDQCAGFEAQRRQLREHGAEKIFEEQVSSVASRGRLEAALDFVREGDTLVVTKLDRLARSTAHALAIMERLRVKEVGLRVLDLALDTNTPTGALMFSVIAAVAQFEREMMLERQREGIAKAKAGGLYKGRAPTARAKAAEIRALAAEGLTKPTIAKRLGIGERSVFRVLSTTGESGAGFKS